MNERIRAQNVRVIGPDGEQLGILPIKEALAFAEEKELDLVEVARDANPPVCRVMDYGKYKYMQKKRQQESKRKQSHIHVKEVKFRIKIEDHDFNFKVRNIRKFITEGHKVKVTIFFRGREITRQDLGRGVLKRVMEEVQDIATADQDMRFEGRMMWMMISPISRRAKTTETGTKGGGEHAENEEQPGSGQAIQSDRPGQDSS